MLSECDLLQTEQSLDLSLLISSDTLYEVQVFSGKASQFSVGYLDSVSIYSDESED
jgi:hypothetical protein